MKTGRKTQQQRKEESLDILRQNEVFVTPEDTERIHRYQEGKYVLGKAMINAAVEEHHGDKCSTALCRAVMGNLKRRSYVKRSEFNKFDRCIPVENGVLDLKTFKLMPHTPDKIFTFKLKVKYDPDKKAPKFMNFMSEIVKNKEDLLVLQEYAGYILLPAFPHHYFLILLGAGRNGKGSFVRTLIGIIGKENISQVPLEQLDGKHRFAAANLYGKLMNVCSEPAAKKALSTEIIKRATGQDILYGEIKNIQNPISFISFAKYIILANNLPPVYDPTLSFWDRLKLIEFTETFTDEKGNKTPDIEHLWLDNPDERSGILNWMIEGLMRLTAQKGITQSKTMKKMKLEYKRVSDPIGAFLTDEDQVIYGSRFWVTRAELYEAYTVYAEDIGGITETPKKLGGRVKRLPRVLARQKKIDKKQTKIWQGIGLVGAATREQRLLTEETETVETGVSHPGNKNIQNNNKTEGENRVSPVSLPEEDDSSPAASADPHKDLTDDAVLFLEEHGGRMQQEDLFKALIKRGYHFVQANTVLRGDKRFVFMGMTVRMGTTGAASTQEGSDEH